MTSTPIPTPSSADHSGSRPDPQTPILLGLPYDGSSSFLAGPALAPEAVRRVLHCGAGNWTTERGVELEPDTGVWIDAGDLDVPADPAEAYRAVRALSLIHI